MRFVSAASRLRAKALQQKISGVDLLLGSSISAA